MEPLERYILEAAEMLDTKAYDYTIRDSVLHEAGSAENVRIRQELLAGASQLVDLRPKLIELSRRGWLEPRLEGGRLYYDITRKGLDALDAPVRGPQTKTVAL